MKLKNTNIENRVYFTPKVEHIKLDNEISLALESTPPEGPGESMNITPEYFYNEPFKNDLG